MPAPKNPENGAPAKKRYKVIVPHHRDGDTDYAKDSVFEADDLTGKYLLTNKIAVETTEDCNHISVDWEKVTQGK